MPIVISEIEISVEVTPEGDRHNAGPAMSSSSKEEIIKECVERVLELINQKSER